LKKGTKRENNEKEKKKTKQALNKENGVPGTTLSYCIH
jgi:hypothetical protein